jgi:hypothetical protein
MASPNPTVQILNDGYRNTTIKIDGYLNAADLSAVTILDPANLSQMDGQGRIPDRVRVNRINFDVQDGIQIDLNWDGVTPASLWKLTGRGEIKAKPFGGIVDNATTPNGKITATTIGGGATTTNTSYTIVLELVKYHS